LVGSSKRVVVGRDDLSTTWPSLARKSLNVDRLTLRIKKLTVVMTSTVSSAIERGLTLGTLVILGATLLWCCYSMIEHSFYSTISNRRYRIGVVAALGFYLLGEIFLLIYEFDGMSDSVFFFHILVVFLTFPITISIDTFVLLIFRILNPKIPARLVKLIEIGSWIHYLAIPTMSGYAYLSPSPSPGIITIAKILRFTNAICFAVYHTFACGYLINLVYSNISKKRLVSLEKALTSTFRMLSCILGINTIGLAVYGYALTLHDLHPLRFPFLHLSNSGLGMQMNLLISLFLHVTKLQFSERRSKVVVEVPEIPNTVKCQPQ
jgi:hypothetical protein